MRQCSCICTDASFLYSQRTNTLKDYPLSVVRISQFCNKQALLVILILSENDSTRFNRLGKLIPDISTKMLAGTLHTLEADGLVKRIVFPEVPIRVEYELTPLGCRSYQ